MPFAPSRTISLQVWPQLTQKFPLSNWCQLLPQAELTLNLLCPSQLNPKLSAYAQLEGIFDFNKTPLAPPGTHVIIHEKPAQCQTWAPHGIDRWYVGPALDHYQCHRVWIPSTRSECMTDTLQFFPTVLRTPTLSHQDATIRAAQELSHALKQQHNNPVSHLTDPQLRALGQLSTLFTTMPPGVELTMPKSSSPSQFNQHPDFPTNISSPPVPQPYYKLLQCLPTTPYATPVTHADTGTSMEYCDLIMDPTTKDIWLHSAANEFGCLAQGLPDKHVDHTNAIFFIPINKVPPNKRPTYACFVCSYYLQKAEPHHTHLTVGGNLIDYPGNLSMKVADMTTFKILVNSTLSTPGACWLGLNIKNYYLGTPMDHYEYMFIPINLIPPEIIDSYNLHKTAHKGKVYVEICHGMYGLPQSGILAEKQLICFLGNYGYCPVLQAIVELKKRGVFAHALIKKRRYWPKHVPGEQIIQHFADKAIGSADAIKGELDEVPFYIYGMKEPDYTMMLMSMYGALQTMGLPKNVTTWREVLRRVLLLFIQRLCTITMHIMM